MSEHLFEKGIVDVKEYNNIKDVSELLEKGCFLICARVENLSEEENPPQETIYSIGFTEELKGIKTTSEIQKEQRDKELTESLEEFEKEFEKNQEEFLKLDGVTDNGDGTVTIDLKKANIKTI